LFFVDQSIPLAQRFEFVSQCVKRYLHKVLVVTATDVNLLFDAGIILAFLKFAPVKPYFSTGFLPNFLMNYSQPLRFVEDSCRKRPHCV
jgi:hypothetical protein